MPITTEQQTIVKSTVPLLETGGVTLTTHFYKMMLSEYPQVKVLFNASNQSDGAQPRALAQAVLCYAKYIDRLENLGDLVAQIIHKHVALNVLPEHYPIVGSCLIRSIREVLGAEIATDAVIDAWTAAYTSLADLLIGLEEDLYAKAAAATGGWRGLRDFKVASRAKEADGIVSLTFVPADGKAVIGCAPGQYIGMRIEVPIEGETVAVQRNYSVSAAPNGESLRITVKLHEHGAVSPFLHALEEGATVQLFPPAGAFSLKAEETRPVVFLSAGVGATPLFPMLETCAASGRQTTYIHTSRNAAVHPFREAVEKIAADNATVKVATYYTRPREGTDDALSAGRVDQATIAKWIADPAETDVYFVGPAGFMKDVKKALLEIGVPAGQIHYEFFGPAAALD